MADGDGAAVHVHFRRVPADGFVDGAGLRGKGLVCFDQVEVMFRPARLFQRTLRGRNRRLPMMEGRRPSSPGNDARHGSMPRFSAAERFIATTAASPSLMPLALPAVPVPALSKAGRSLARSYGATLSRIDSS